MSKFNWWMKACGILLLWTTAAIALPAQSPAPTFTLLYNFASKVGAYPNGGLIQATNGDLYGVTGAGGIRGGCPTKYGACGTIFKITTAGVLKRVDNFCPQRGCSDGKNPEAGLVESNGGEFYGTTAFGGGANDDGTVFKITSDGTLITLHAFDGTDGSFPAAALIQSKDGNFYGTTPYGGTNSNSGTAFKITPTGALTTIYNFCAQFVNKVCMDGTFPDGALVQGTDGDLYGTTAFGGTNNDGTVFRITTNGELTTLHSFDGTDGALPNGLAQGSDGKFYGTTGEGGGSNRCSLGCGTVFKVTRSGKLTTLQIFDWTNGAEPSSGVIQATDGNFYGTTPLGGTNAGTAFKLTTSGKLTTLHNFCSQDVNCTDGVYPSALVQDTNGTLYGVTQEGGTDNKGTIFSLSVGLGPLVTVLPISGNVWKGR
jgi:uncharacterized repeat protein (TIGR03803 family)